MNEGEESRVSLLVFVNKRLCFTRVSLFKLGNVVEFALWKEYNAIASLTTERNHKYG